MTEELNTDDKAHQELKAFMNEPDPPADEAKAPAPMMTDDWEPTEGRQTDHRLSTAEITQIAYQTVMTAQYMSKLDSVWVGWESLGKEQVDHWIHLSNFFMSSIANPNGQESCEAWHHFEIDRLLLAGWRYGEQHSDEDKMDPMIRPYRNLPFYFKNQIFLFRSTIVGLMAVWRGN